MPYAGMIEVAHRVFHNRSIHIILYMYVYIYMCPAMCNVMHLFISLVHICCGHVYTGDIGRFCYSGGRDQRVISCFICVCS